ncbi:MAG TPA: FecR domain-containing protein [Bacteroidales bacterium]|nr:FecR domain-containing protein [Bacteroidales bacterium]HQL69263.1 FecR domain-containing protein [Bacteroidales bacterium]
MQEPNTYDYDLLAAFIADKLTAEQVEEVKQRLANDVGFSRLYRQFLLIYKTHSGTESFDTEAALIKTRHKISANNSRSRFSYKLLLYAAAVTCLIIVSVGIVTMLGKKSGVETQWLSFTATDSIGHTQLGDGSKITLNKNSEIKYAANFGSQNTREVSLNGEAFFEVSSDKQKPFIVKTASTEIRVTGTRFLVSNQPGGDVMVWVEEGSVMVKQNKDENSVSLHKGEKALCKADSNEIIKTAGSGNEVFWVENRLSFYNTPLPDVISAIEKAYGCQIGIADSSIRQMRLTSSFTNEQADKVLNVIALTLGLRVEKQGQQFMLYAE